MSALRFVSKVDLQILQFLLHSEQFTLPPFALHDELENTDGYVNRLANLSQFIVARHVILAPTARLWSRNLFSRTEHVEGIRIVRCRRWLEPTQNGLFDSFALVHPVFVHRREDGLFPTDFLQQFERFILR